MNPQLTAQLEQHAPASIERLAPETLKTFDNAEEIILSIQDSKAFADKLTEYNLPYDDTTPDYWQTVRTVTAESIKLGDYVGTPNLLSAVRIVAATPDVAFKQYFLNEAAEYNLDYTTRREYVNDISTFNTLVRNYIADNIHTPFDSFSRLLSDSASKGIDQSLIGPVGKMMQVHLKGIRTELGFEQKAAAAGLSVQRGTTEQDLKGIDYVVDGLEVDIKSSLYEVIGAKGDSDITEPFIVKNKKVLLYPYENATDYENNTFRIKESVIDQRAAQLAADFLKIKAMVA